jgi:hypothetical protein
MKPQAFSLLSLLAVFVRPCGAAEGASAYVDPEGTLRWTASKAEIIQFGTNYTAPFAFSFRAHARLGIPIEKAIDADVYHLARMGLDAYRVHVWDRQISDAQGNVLSNEHLAAFDYLLAKLKARGFKIVLTPLVFGDAGYPETRVPSGEGFSGKYGKQGCLENRESWPLQERYLGQFVSHVNPDTGIALKDDPDIIGFEICNEPGHFEYGAALEYINTMIQAIRATGCAKPLFYNMSHGIPVAQAYLDSDAQGGTFQWYPSGLVAGHEQLGNFLPYVEDYPIPFADNPKFKAKAKLVYEFDSADIGRTYLYPAMARSFRAAGMQFATQFAYDPMYLAPYNTEYQTHFLNLAYTPQKALSMKIAAEAFRRVPRFTSYGSYPADTSFEGVRVSYKEDLAELVTERKFFYTNPTATAPPAPASLEEVAGFGTSPVVGYPGRGAYFLDRLEPGVWRLEVMPDAVWVSDPFAKASPKKQVARIAWNAWPMTVRLPDLGPAFHARGLDEGNAYSGQAANGSLTVRPGAYLLSRGDAPPRWNRSSAWKNLTLGEFVAPPPSVDRDYVVHAHPAEVTEGQDVRVSAVIASPAPGRTVTLVAFPPSGGDPRPPRPEPGRRGQPGGGFVPGPGAPGSHGPDLIPMTGRGLDYSAVIPGAELHPGTLRYFIVVEDGASAMTFPSEFPGRPSDWDFYGSPWEERVVARGSPILLFEAASDMAAVTYDSREQRSTLVPSDQPGSSALRFMAWDLDLGEHDASIRFFFRNKAGGRLADTPAPTRIVLYGRSASGAPGKVQLALVTSDGFAYGTVLTVGGASGRCSAPIVDLAPVRSPNIPHGYPVFLRYWSKAAAHLPFNLRQAESLLVSLGPGLGPDELAKPAGIEIERVWLE